MCEVICFFFLFTNLSLTARALRRAAVKQIVADFGKLMSLKN